MTRHEKLTLGVCGAVVIVAASLIYSCQSVAQEHGGQTLLRLARTTTVKKSPSPALSQPSQPSTNSSAWRKVTGIAESNTQPRTLPLTNRNNSIAGSNPAALTPPAFTPVIRTNRPPPVPMTNITLEWQNDIYRYPSPMWVGGSTITNTNGLVIWATNGGHWTNFYLDLEQASNDMRTGLVTVTNLRTAGGILRTSLPFALSNRVTLKMNPSNENLRAFSGPKSQ